MDSPSSHARKYGRSCLKCRKRKVRCDTRKPCNQCLRTGNTCSYKEDVRNAELATQLQRAEEQLQSLQSSVNELTRSPDSDSVSKDGEMHTSGLTSDLTTDESGRINYYGATSRFHDRSFAEVTPGMQAAEEEYHRRWLKSNARFQSSWESRAYERLSTDLSQPDIDGASARLLMEIYWTWQAPLHNCVYRRCFFRDMALDGPYFSPFLLNVILAHACRHTRKDDSRFYHFNNGESFLKRAKALLVDEMEIPKVPTIQGLLILGGRQCAIGKSSEGWLYTSMSISMIRDLGLHLPKSSGHLMTETEPDDLEARKRLYLSAFTWDKSISLCLGRPPQLREMPYPFTSLLDHADDQQAWTPIYLSTIENCHPEPTLSHTTSTFSAFCEFAGMADKLYAEIYGPAVKSIRFASVRELEEQIRTLFGRLPTHLRLDSDVSEMPYPPPHILCMNVFYHTLLILLYRPFSEIDGSAITDIAFNHHARKVCAEEAARVNAHFQTYGRAFNYKNQTYLLSYCVYTAATIEVQYLQDGDALVASAAAERLLTTLRMLEVEAEQTPGIRRSIDIIRSQIDRMPSPDRIVQSHQVELQRSAANRLPLNNRTVIAGEALTDGFRQVTSEQGTNEPASTNDGDSSMEANAELLWFDWNAFDVTGGFPLFDGSTWPP